MLYDSIAVGNQVVILVPNSAVGGFYACLTIVKILVITVSVFVGHGSGVILRQHVEQGNAHASAVEGGGIHFDIDAVQGSHESFAAFEQFLFHNPVFRLNVQPIVARSQ
jgi:hypothetical protein